MRAPKLTSKVFQKELSGKKLDRIYLFTGEEEGEKDKFVRQIIDIAFKGSDEADYSVGRFHADNDEFNAACEFALSMSMFSERKLCVICNIQALNSKNEKELLGELIENLPDSNILILTSLDNKIPACISSGMVGKIKTVQFWKYFESDLSSYIVNTVRGYGIKIERDAVNLLVELLGRDIKKIDNSIEKIVYAGEKQITVSTVENYVSFERDVSVFDYVSALFRRDKKAFYLLVKILESGVYELAVLSLVFRQAELIEKYHDLVRGGMTGDDAAQKLGVFPKNRKDFFMHVRNFSREGIKGVFPLIYRADYRIKSHSFSSSILENPVFELTADIVINS